MGFDNEGYGGITGYLMRLAINNPTSFASLLGRLVPLQIKAPVRHSLDLSKLTDAELIGLENIVAKAQIQIVDGEAVDDDETPTLEHVVSNDKPQ